MNDIVIEQNAPLAPYTTLQVGGPARFLVRAATEEHVSGALLYARKRGCPVFVLGGGSNVVISDSGFPGLVLKMELSGIDREPGSGRISVAAGEDWDRFVGYCVDRGLAGVECLSGIPGTAGGTPVQNVGAYGQEVGEVIAAVRALDRESGSIEEIGTLQCRFAYRASIFNTTAAGRYIVLQVRFELRPEGEPTIRYPDLQRHFDGRARPPSLTEIRQAVLQIRGAKGMVLRDGDPDCRSAGSFFKNPVLIHDEVSALEERARANGLITAAERIPRFPAGAGKEKVAAAWLVERAGFRKGFTSGRVGLSGSHSLALVNRGGAQAREVIDLMHSIQDRVSALFGVELHPEPVFVGFQEPVASRAGREIEENSERLD